MAKSGARQSQPADVNNTIGGQVSSLRGIIPRLDSKTASSVIIAASIVCYINSLWGTSKSHIVILGRLNSDLSHRGLRL